MSKTFDDFDQLDLGGFAERLTSYIQTERHFVDGALLISLNGKFGCGKSTFFEMWRNRLKTDANAPFATILLNAWDADFERDPLFSIVRGLVRHFEDSGVDVLADNLKETAGKLGRFALALSNDVVAKFTGLDIQKAGEMAEPKKPDLTGMDCFKAFKERQRVFARLKEQLAHAVAAAGKPIIVMLDELDRCRPDHAVEYLETIKHIFDVGGLVFVLGIDKATLSSSVRSLYGASLDFDEYYRKFVHRNVLFPRPDERVLYRFSASLVTRYLHSEALAESGRHNFAGWDRHRVENLAELFEDFALSPRQMHEVFRLLAHCLNCSKDQQAGMLWGWQIGTILLATLSVAKPDHYHAWGRGTITPEDIADQLLGCRGMLSSERKNLWWIVLICLGLYGQTQESVSNFKTILAKLSILVDEESNEVLEGRLKEMVRAYDHFGLDRRDKKPFEQIYRTLEGIQQFGRD